MHRIDRTTYTRPGGKSPLVYGPESNGRVGHVPTSLRVGLIGTYPPTECGIATFTANVRDALLLARPDWDVTVVTLVDEMPWSAPPEVARAWVRDQSSSLQRSVDHLNECDVVLVQHEFGIYGGRDGEEVLDLVDSLRVPVVVSLHTVLSSPTPHQSYIIQRLIDNVDLVVVPSGAALARLTSVHQMDNATVVPHGAASNFADDRIEGERPMILTWGLLGPGKGIEQGIRTVSMLRGLEPTPRYVIAGRTHPNLRRNGLDPYRRSLEALVEQYDVGDVVTFDDRYMNWSALRALVRRASIVLLPYQSRDQISSGVLVEALASGKPVVATRFPHAVEMLSNGAGMLVDFDDVEAMARALRTVLEWPDFARTMTERSRRVGRTLLWPHVGEKMCGLLEELTEVVKR